MSDTIAKSRGAVGGWVVLPSYDHHVNTENCLACQSVPFIRDLKRYTRHVVMFTQVSFQIPLVNADGTLDIQSSRKQNYVALYIHAGKWSPAMGTPLTIDLGAKKDLIWGLSRRNIAVSAICKQSICELHCIRVLLLLRI